MTAGIMIITIIINFVVGFVIDLISKDGCEAIEAAIVANFLLIALYALL